MAARDADEEEPVGKVVLYGTVSVDGFIADERDQPGPLFDWLTAGDVPLDDAGRLKVSQASADVTRAYWDEIGVTVVGRHVFDLTDGWGGVPPAGIDHVVVVSHRPAPGRPGAGRGARRRGAYGRRAGRARRRQALLREGRRATPARGSRGGRAGHSGAPPAPPGAPMTGRQS